MDAIREAISRARKGECSRLEVNGVGVIVYPNPGVDKEPDEIPWEELSKAVVYHIRKKEDIERAIECETERNPGYIFKPKYLVVDVKSHMSLPKLIYGFRKSIRPAMEIGSSPIFSYDGVLLIPTHMVKSMTSKMGAEDPIDRCNLTKNEMATQSYLLKLLDWHKEEVREELEEIRREMDERLRTQ